MSEIAGIIRDTGAYRCLDCGKCTAVCPVARNNPDFSPRKLVADAIARPNDLLGNSLLWSCVTCSRCEQRCHAGVRYTELVRGLRGQARAADNPGECSHGGALQALTGIMGAGNLHQDRLGWMDSGLKTADESDTLYFAGCHSYFDVLFAHLPVNTGGIARGAVKLLNRLGITPALLPDELCCGHDRLWSGDEAGFLRLARRNVEQIKRSGARRVVTACPECYHTLKVDYPRFLGATGVEVVHISQVLSGQLGGLKLRRINKKVTYHDPCRLGRFSGIYDEPRAMLAAIPGLELVEMSQNRKNAPCCGTQAWANCGAVNRRIQSELLAEASRTGARLLVTSCPKCQIHLKCALHGSSEVAQIQIEDVVSLLARSLAGPEGRNG